MSEARNLDESITITETHVYTAVMVERVEVDIQGASASIEISFIGDGRVISRRVIIDGALYDSWTDDDDVIFSIIKEHASTIIHAPRHSVKLEAPVVEEAPVEAPVEAPAEESVEA